MDRIVWIFRNRDSNKPEISVVGTPSARHFVEALQRGDVSTWVIRKQNWLEWRNVSDVGRSWDWGQRAGANSYGLAPSELPEPVSDRRRFERFEGELRVGAVELNAPGSFLECSLRDLSLGGVRLRYPDDRGPVAGSQLRVRFTAPEFRMELERMAEVVDCRNGCARLRFLGGDNDHVSLGLLMTQLLAQKKLRALRDERRV